MKNSFLIALFLTLNYVMNAQGINSPYDIVPAEMETWSDSSDAMKNTFYKGGQKQLEYYKSDAGWIRKKYHLNGKLMAYCPIIITMDVDTEFVEDEFGDIAPIVVTSDWYIKPTGLYKEYGVNGKLRIEGNYNEQGKTGEWKSYNFYGSLDKVCTYYQNKLKGEYTQYGSTGYGDNQKTIVLVKGEFIIVNHPHFWGEPTSIKNGSWKSYDYYGKLIREEEHKWLNSTAEE